MSTIYKILIIEDDQVISSALKEHIKNWGYEAECINDFQNVMAEFAAYGPHLVLLDISLPFHNGYHWCSEIRKLSSIPIIFISSASDNMNIVMALSQGGDDFVAKPFNLDVLTVKIQALLRRTYDFSETTELLEHAGAILDIAKNTLTYHEKEIELTKNEFKILQTLFENKGKIVSRDAMMKRLWDTDSFVDDNTLTVNVTRLRRKLSDVGLDDFITTKKGVGYMVE